MEKKSAHTHDPNTLHFYVITNDVKSQYCIGFTCKSNHRIINKIMLSAIMYKPRLQYFISCSEVDQHIFLKYFACEKKPILLQFMVFAEIIGKEMGDIIDEFYRERKVILPEIPYLNTPVCDYVNGEDRCKNLVFRNGKSCSMHNSSLIYYGYDRVTCVVNDDDLKRKIAMEENLSKRAELVNKFSLINVLTDDYFKNKIKPLVSVKGLDSDKIVEVIRAKTKKAIETKSDLDQLYIGYYECSSLLGLSIAYVDPNCVKLLLSNGANPNAETIDGFCCAKFIESFYYLDYLINNHFAFCKDLGWDNISINIENIRKKIDNYDSILLLLINYGIDLTIGTCKNLINKNIGYARLFYNRFVDILEYLYEVICVVDLNMIILEYYLDIRVYKKLKWLFD